MKKWEKIAELHIYRRSKQSILDIDLSTPDNGEPSLHDVFSNYDGRIQAENDEGWGVIEAPGIREAARSELSRLLRKSSEAVEATTILLQNGKCKWGTVDAYHASLLNIKAILGYFGIFITQTKTSSFAIDISPSFADPRIRKEWDAAANSFSSPVKVITRNEPTIGHSAVVTLFRRLFAVNYQEIVGNDDVRKALRKLDVDRYHPLRNRVIYISSYIPDLQLDGLPAAGEKDWLEKEHRDYALLSNILSTDLLRRP